jgi:hypothetical protein
MFDSAFVKRKTTKFHVYPVNADTHYIWSGCLLDPTAEVGG